MKNNNIKAFSLIEIVQTVVLLGIIAGLSVSFFRQVNTDGKLREATEVQLFEALQEANNQMCSDETPYCEGTYNAAAAPNPANNIIYGYEVTSATSCCAADYAGSAFNPNTGFCEIAPQGGICNIDMILNSTGTTCYAPPKCHGGGNNANPNAVVCGNAVMRDAGAEITARPLHAVVCPNNGPLWSHFTRRIIGGTAINLNANSEVTEICYRLWSLINHDKRGNDDYNDLMATCNPPAGVGRIANPCVLNRNCANQNAQITPSMLLPNGAAIYNMSCIGKTICPSDAAVVNKDAQNLYIKIDRNNGNINTINQNTTSVFNAVHLCPNNNIITNNNYDNGNNEFNGNSENPEYTSALLNLYGKANPKKEGEEAEAEGNGGDENGNANGNGAEGEANHQ